MTTTFSKRYTVPLIPQGDMTDTARLQDALAADAVAHGLDVRVSNAARDQLQATAEVPPKEWNNLLAINLNAATGQCMVVDGGVVTTG